MLYAMAASRGPHWVSWPPTDRSHWLTVGRIVATCGDQGLAAREFVLPHVVDRPVGVAGSRIDQQLVTRASRLRPDRRRQRLLRCSNVRW